LANVAGIEMAGEYEDRKRLTFEQAEGAEPLPSQLKLREVSRELRARLWSVFHQLLTEARQKSAYDLEDQLEGILPDILYDWHVIRCFEPADEFVPSYEYWLDELKPLFMEGHYTKVFGFLQWVLRHETKLYGLDIGVDVALRESRAAYSLFENDTIIPIGSDAERESLARHLPMSPLPSFTAREPTCGTPGPS
jgi:hypothetical protein